MTSKEAVLEIENVTKRFGDIVANDSISLSVHKGEVHGLLGENGAGKSTLMNILYGLYSPTSGQITFKKEPRSFDSPKDAICAGIGMVHQHFMLVPKMTVLENIVLGERETEVGSSDSGILSRFGRLFGRGRDTPRERIRELSEEYGLDIDPDMKVWELDIGEQQRVEILKALYRDIDLLILDEPTAVLTPKEAKRMFETIRQLVNDGLTVIFITHKLWEIEQMADRVTVLRDGKKIETVDADDVTKEDLARKMVGREVLFRLDKERVRIGDAVLKTDGLCAKDDRGVSVVSGLDVTVREGEIVGVAGVSGNGQREFAECLIGYRPIESGRVEINGTDLTGRSPRSFVDAGVSFIPEDRYEYGCAEDLSVMHNAGSKVYRNGKLGDSRFLLNYSSMADHADDLVDEFDVRGVTDVKKTAARDLSGGNLQKLILGREMSREPNVLIANQPTRGVDVGAIESIRELMLEQRQDGTGVLLISEDLDELLDLCDRILVIFDGEFVYETTSEETDKWELGVYMSTGSEPDEAESEKMLEEAE